MKKTENQACLGCNYISNTEDCSLYHSILKRDNSATTYPQVRLLTIHGSKGLEAPIIYLPDMLTAKTPSDTLTFSQEWIYWTENSNFAPSFIKEIRKAEKEKIKREDDRLLYVALTRAKQALIIAGWEAPARRVIKNSWYELLKDTISNCLLYTSDAADE